MKKYVQGSGHGQVSNGRVRVGYQRSPAVSRGMLLYNLAANNYKIPSTRAYSEVKSIFCISKQLLVRHVGVAGVGLTETLALLPLLPDTLLSFLMICGELLAY